MINQPMTYMGLEIIINPNIPTTERKEDWSKSRSPSRAKRRLKRGFKQHVVVTYEPKTEILKIGNTLVMHPDTYKEFLKKMDDNGRFIKQDSYSSYDLQLPRWDESKMQERNIWSDYVWKDRINPFNIARIYGA